MALAVGLERKPRYPQFLSQPKDGAVVTPPTRMRQMLQVRSTSRKTLLGALVLVLVSIGTGYAVWHHARSGTPRVHRLADGTIASFAADTRLVPAPGFPVRREVSLDGKALLKVPAARLPLIIHTRLMRIAVIRPSTLLVIARSRQAGEEVEVLHGEVIVSKSYPSTYRVPDDLRAGEMSMVNQTIDLMEKERMGALSLTKIRESANALK